MGDQHECICPLCMKAMDLTDRELQPCICGYEICLWCWHFIIQTATKDGSDARCPSCHTPYDKEKILKRTINKERLELANANKKHKLQKSKQSLPDVGKDLHSIRVIRRNIVYIAGIPKKLSDEKILRRKEYLGQYGKIVKIFFAQKDVPRQHYSLESCIVYVNFSKDEEALRCIQVVNGYILDGMLLKACFGTTRYCYSWLSNLPCKNPDCLYVHDVVPQEDICSKEDVNSFCTSKLQQCPGLAFTNLKQHSGSFLPPPLDSKNSLPPLGFISNNRCMQSDYCGRSYASVAASRNQPNASSMNDISFPKHGTEIFSYAKPFVGICNSIKRCSPEYETSAEAYLMAENNLYNPSFLENHMPERIIEQFCPDVNSRLSSTSANIMAPPHMKCEAAEHYTKEFSLEWNYLGADSRKYESFLSSQALSDVNSSAQQNSLPSYGLGSERFNCSFEDDTLSALFSGKLKNFSTFSTIATDLYDRSSSCSGWDCAFSHTHKIGDEKFLNLSYMEPFEERIISDILALDINTIDDPGSVLEQHGGSVDLTRISNSYFSMMDDVYFDSGKSPPSSSLLTKNSSCSDIMTRKGACIENSLNNFCTETSKTSKILKKAGILSATDAVGVSGSSLVLNHSGSSLYSQHQHSNTIQRTTLSTPPGFPPRKLNQGNATQNQTHKSFSGNRLSINQAISNTDCAENTSYAKEFLPPSISNAFHFSPFKYN